MSDQDKVMRALAEHAPLLLEWLSSGDLNPEAIERGHQVQAFINAIRAIPVKRAILVLGPESSGTRMLTRMCLEAGCDGDPSHKQRWDKEDPDSALVVYRQSFPHGGETPDVTKLVARFLKLGYRVRVVVIVRDWIPTVRSQISNGHSGSVAEAERRLRGALVNLFVGLQSAGVVDYRLMAYEALESQSARVELARYLELDLECFARFPFTNENLKHYQVSTPEER